MSKKNNTVWVSGVEDINTIRGALGVSFGKDENIQHPQHCNSKHIKQMKRGSEREN